MPRGGETEPPAPGRRRGGIVRECSLTQVGIVRDLELLRNIRVSFRGRGKDFFLRGGAGRRQGIEWPSHVGEGQSPPRPVFLGLGTLGSGTRWILSAVTCIVRGSSIPGSHPLGDGSMTPECDNRKCLHAPWGGGSNCPNKGNPSPTCLLIGACLLLFLVVRCTQETEKTTPS